MTVREILTREYVGVSEADAVDDAVDLMLDEGTSSVVVLRGTEPVGMLTAADALSLVLEDDDAGATAVGEVMSGTVPTVPPGASIVEAASEMADADIGSLLAVDGDEVVGVVSERDVVRATATLADRAGLAGNAEPASVDGAVAVEAEEASAETATTEYGGGTNEGEYSTQSVCEACGSLTPDLQEFNGQLLCADCRAI